MPAKMATPTKLDHTHNSFFAGMARSYLKKMNYGVMAEKMIQAQRF